MYVLSTQYTNKIVTQSFFATLCLFYSLWVIGKAFNPIQLQSDFCLHGISNNFFQHRLSEITKTDRIVIHMNYVVEISIEAVNAFDETVYKRTVRDAIVDTWRRIVYRNQVLHAALRRMWRNTTTWCMVQESPQPENFQCIFDDAHRRLYLNLHWEFLNIRKVSVTNDSGIDFFSYTRGSLWKIFLIEI